MFSWNRVSGWDRQDKSRVEQDAESNYMIDLGRGTALRSPLSYLHPNERKKKAEMMLIKIQTNNPKAQEHNKEANNPQGLEM